MGSVTEPSEQYLRNISYHIVMPVLSTALTDAEFSNALGEALVVPIPRLC